MSASAYSILITENEDGQQHLEESKIVTPERSKMKRRTIDMMIRHQRNSSLSSLGSGDWASDVGASVEDRSTGEQSASDHSSRVRIVAEMAILASTSPEIKALSQKRGEGFQQTIHGSAILRSPTSSSASSSSTSHNSLSVASLISEESKCDDLEPTTNVARSTAEQLALSLENLRIEPPPAPKREQVADIASIIDSDTKENFPKPCFSTGSSGTNAGRNRHRLRRRPRSSQRETFGSCTSASSSKRPPKPLKSTVVTPRSPVRRPSMHRRVSFDSLPTPSEIGTSVPALFCSCSSDRSFFCTPSSELSSPFQSSSSERSKKPQQRRGTSRLGAPRSLNLSKGI